MVIILWDEQTFRYQCSLAGPP